MRESLVSKRGRRRRRVGRERYGIGSQFLREGGWAVAQPMSFISACKACSVPEALFAFRRGYVRFDLLEQCLSQSIDSQSLCSTIKTRMFILANSATIGFLQRCLTFERKSHKFIDIFHRSIQCKIVTLKFEPMRRQLQLRSNLRL